MSASSLRRPDTYPAEKKSELFSRLILLRCSGGQSTVYRWSKEATNIIVIVVKNGLRPKVMLRNLRDRNCFANYREPTMIQLYNKITNIKKVLKLKTWPILSSYVKNSKYQRWCGQQTTDNNSNKNFAEIQVISNIKRVFLNATEIWAVPSSKSNNHGKSLKELASARMKSRFEISNEKHFDDYVKARSSCYLV